MLHAKLLRNCFLRNPTQVLAETLEAGSVLCQQEFQDAVVQRGRAQVWWGTFPPSPGPRDDHLNDERREHFCTGSSRWTSILLQPCTFGFPSVNQLGDLCIEEGSGEVCRETMQVLAAKSWQEEKNLSFHALSTTAVVKIRSSVQFSSVAQLCPTLCNPMNRNTPGLPVHHQLPESTQTHVH